MYYLGLDIETVKNDRAHDFFFKDGMAKPDARLKKEDKIKENLEEQFSKSALKWYLGKVICICATVYDKENNITLETFSHIDDDEWSLLKAFADFCVEMDQKYIGLMPFGKSSKAFDFPFLTGRYLFYGNGIPAPLYSQKAISDIDDIFIRYGRSEQTTSLANYAWGLQIDGKLEKDGGSKVQEWYDNRDFETILSYCKQDVNICIDIMRRYKPYVKQ